MPSRDDAASVLVSWFSCPPAQSSPSDNDKECIAALCLQQRLRLSSVYMRGPAQPDPVNTLLHLGSPVHHRRPPTRSCARALSPLSSPETRTGGYVGAVEIKLWGKGVTVTHPSDPVVELMRLIRVPPSLFLSTSNSSSINSFADADAMGWDDRAIKGKGGTIGAASASAVGASKQAGNNRHRGSCSMLMLVARGSYS